MAQAPKVDPEEIVKTLSEQWDKVDNKGNRVVIKNDGQDHTEAATMRPYLV